MPVRLSRLARIEFELSGARRLSLSSVGPFGLFLWILISFSRAAPRLANACPWSWKEREVKTPTLPQAGRIGHPQKPNQFLAVAVHDWYNPTMTVRQKKKTEGAGHPPVFRSRNR